jgi:hypothetical protein
MRYLLVLGLGSALFLQSCQGVESQASRVKSGYTSMDCSSLKRQFDFQSKKLPSLIEQFDAASSQSSNGNYDSSDSAVDPVNDSGAFDLADQTGTSIGALVVPASPVIAQGSIRSIQDCSKLSMNNNEAYGACREVFLVFKAVEDAAEAYNDPERPDSCIEGAGQKVDSQLFAYCDSQCSFGDANCTACSFTYSNSLGTTETAKMVCATKTSTMEAINTFCQISGDGRCPITSCNTDKGRFFSQSGSSGNIISGSNQNIDSVELSGFLGSYANVDISAGVKAEVGVSVKSRVSGLLKISASNANQQITEQSGIYSAGTQVRCTVEISSLEDFDINTRAGVEASFKLFGNGASAGVGVTTGGSIRLSRTLLKTSPMIPAGGQPSNIVLGQCKEYIKGWLARDLIEHVKNYEGFRVVREAIEQGSGKIGSDSLTESAQARGEAAASSVYRRLGWVGYYKACARASTFGAWTGASSDGDAACKQDSMSSPSNHQGIFYKACRERLDKICRGEVRS